MSVQQPKEDSITELAQKILTNTQVFAKCLQLEGHALPTWAPTNQEPPTNATLWKLQDELRLQLEDLGKLIDGPSKFYRHYLNRGYDIGAFQVALDFGFFEHIPTDGEISLEDLARKAGLDRDRTGRLIRILITHRFFQELKPGFFSHNSFSWALQKDDELRSMVHYSFDEMFKATAETSVSLKANPFDADSKHCPFYTRYEIPIFDYYYKHPEYSARFAKAMAGWRKMNNSIVELRDNFDWKSLNGTVVDIGGGSGHCSAQLAKAFPHLKFAVQDGGDDMLSQGQRHLTDDIRDRITFTKANFFEPQKVKGAAAYLIRQCTHNWADHDVVTMFKSVVPGLESSPPGTPFILNDIIMPELGSKVDRNWEREMRQVDMIMLVCYGAKQRSLTEFNTLLKQADPRLTIHKVHDQGALGVIEIHLAK